MKSWSGMCLFENGFLESTVRSWSPLLEILAVIFLVKLVGVLFVNGTSLRILLNCWGSFGDNV